MGVSTSGAAVHALQQSATQQPQAGGVAPAEPKFRVVRSISGSKSSVKGSQYIIEDPRTVFYLPEDKQVIVYFEWEGPLGPHHLEGFWKNPEGKIVVLGDFNYEAKQKRFAGYWTLILSESTTPGIWALEAHVDGEVTGTHNFQIAVAPRPPLPPPPRTPLSPSEIYKLALPVVASVEKLDARGRRVGVGSGFLLGQDLIVTGFENIENADSVRVALPGAPAVGLAGAVAWSRREDWAILRMEAPPRNGLAPAKPNSWEVGGRCFSLDSSQEGNRTIVDGTITGAHKFPDVGDRLNLNFTLSRSGSGSPLLNEYGEVIGLVALSSLAPGLSSLEGLRGGGLFAYPGNLFASGSALTSGETMAVPISVIQLPQPGAPLTSFSDMAKSGQFLTPLVRNENIFQGTLAKSIRREGPVLQAVDQRFEYQRADGQLNVLITWHAETKIKKMNAFLKIYDIDNKLLGTAEPAKLNISKSAFAYSSWTLGISRMPLGLYRVDLVIDSDPIWRTFFRLVE